MTRSVLRMGIVTAEWRTGQKSETRLGDCNNYTKLIVLTLLKSVLLLHINSLHVASDDSRVSQKSPLVS